MMELIRKFWNILVKRERVRVLLTLLILLFSSLMQMLGVGSILPLIAVIAKPEVIESNHWLQNLYTFIGFTSVNEFLFFLGLCSLGILLLSNAFLALNQWVTLRLAGAVQRRLEFSLLEGYLHAPYVAHLQRSSAELKRNVLEEAQQFSGIATLGLQLIASSFLIICITGLFLVVNPVLSIILSLFIGSGYALVYFVVQRHLGRIGRERLEANLQRYKMVDEGLGGLKELRLLQRTSWTLKRYTSAMNTLWETRASQSILGTLPKHFIEVLSFGGMLIVVLYLLASQEDIRNTIPLISLFAFGAYRILPAMQGAYNSAMSLRFYAPVLLTIESELSKIKQAGSIDGEMTGDKKTLSFRQVIELRNVSFSFTQDRGYALQNISLTIPCRSFIGFAGETGAGKSTLVNLILGLLNPDKGEIRIDGIQLSGEVGKRWQRILGYVPQDIYLADDTIEHNIAFGLPPSKIDDGAVREAARLAQIQHFIEQQLPDGYQTIVGDRGVRLSGGERQRLGIARALYHRPEVLVLDEATSMLDGETEAKIFSAIQSIAKEVTLIVIAHRLNTIKHADTIYLLDKGVVTASGTFSELLADNDQFRKMAQGFEREGSNKTNS